MLHNKMLISANPKHVLSLCCHIWFPASVIQTVVFEGLILKLMFLLGHEQSERVGAWVTHFWGGGYVSIAVKLKAPPPTSPSLCSIYHSAGFSLFTKDTGLWSPALPGWSLHPRVIEASCRLLAASRSTSRATHIRSHLHPLLPPKVITSTVTVTACRGKTGANIGEQMPLRSSIFSSSKCSMRGLHQDKLFKSMLACDLRGQVAGYQLSPFEYVRACVWARLCARVIVSDCGTGAFACWHRFGRVFWPTYSSRRSSPKKSVLISRLPGRPVCCH